MKLGVVVLLLFFCALPAAAVSSPLHDSGRTTQIWTGPPIEGEPVPALDRDRARRETSLQYEIGIGRVLLEAYGGLWSEGPISARRNIYEADNRSLWPDQVDSLEAVPGEEQMVLTHSTRYVRDALGRPIRENRNDGSLLLTTYDRLGGQAVRLQTGAGTTSAISFDGVGRPVRHIRPNNRGETRYAYDLDGRMLRTQVTTDGTEPWETVYAYDSTGRVVVIDHEDGSSESYTYHPDNTVATKTTRDGIVLDLAYDQANRLLAVTPSLGGTRPASLAPLDAGDRFTYDELSRPLSLERGATLGGALDPSLSVSIPAYDLASRPRREDLGSRTPLAWTYDTWSRPVGIALPDLARPAGGFTGYQRDYDTLDRVIDLGAAGGALGTQNAGASWTWGGDRLYSLETKTALKTSVRYGYIAGRGPQRPDETDESSASRWKVGTLTWGGGEDPTTTALTVPAHVWGQFAYGWRGNDGDPRDGTKIGRQAITALKGGGLDLFAGLGWAWDYDAGVRLSHAVAGRGDVDGRAPPTGDASENRFAYEYGEGDELQRIVREAEGTIAEMEIGAEGRIVARSGVPFAYDAVGRRTEDDRFVYLWNWRSELVQVTVKETWPGGEEEQSPFAGHLVRYEYDAAGRLTHRIHLGPLPEGATDDSLRPHVESRAFVWEQDGLLAEIAYADPQRTQTRWRKTYVPGASGYDDAVQVAVEIVGLPGSTFAGTNLYTYLRDEQGTVLGLVAESEGGEPEQPPIPVRYHYTPYGEVHAELGPELRLAQFDPGLTEATTPSGLLTQDLIDDRSAGAIRVTLTGPIDASTLEAGLDLEVLTSSGWSAIPAAKWSTGFENEDPSRLVVFTNEGWQPETAYRLSLGIELEDPAGRPLLGAEPLEWSMPPLDSSGTIYEQRFPIRYESYVASGANVGGRFPGGQNCLFHGLWTDPVTGLNYARARWYDARNAIFLAEDPLADIDSPNLYAYTGWQPNMSTDPTGELAVVDNLIGGVAAVAIGFGVSKACEALTTDNENCEYTASDALIDFGAGFASSGLSSIGKLKKLEKLGPSAKGALGLAAKVGAETAIETTAQIARHEIAGEEYEVSDAATKAAVLAVGGEGLGRAIKKGWNKLRGGRKTDKIPDSLNQRSNRQVDPPYEPRDVGRQLNKKYPGAVTSHTLPKQSGSNVKLAGRRHPVSGVVFDDRGFPIFDDVAVFDTRINHGIASIKDRGRHFKEATLDLKQKIEAGVVDSALFSRKQLNAIFDGEPHVPGLTWHHHQQFSRLQLVPRGLHRRTGHVGGFKLWFQ